ncbi:MAG TPA: right-handed parallel beta-helix repeat-containing protein, partial [Chthoniobacterales bacterium]|nr:right-handed parallel beta-helix repeat-containing protein [Chthoniobacterales bacterium]
MRLSIGKVLEHFVDPTILRKRGRLLIYLSGGFLGLLLDCNQLAAQPEFPKPPILNVSTDLEQLPLGYHANNILPNSPSQDSAPLLNDAIRWVSHYNTDNPSTPYTQIIALTGNYYFLTTRPLGGRQVDVIVRPENKNDQLQNVTIDLGGSSLFFANALYGAFNMTDCTGLVLSNFSIDYKTLPFTQLVVQRILNSNQIVAVPGPTVPPEDPYVDVYQLAQSQIGAGLYGFDFRAGRLNPSTGRWIIEPLTKPGNTLTLKQGAANLIEPGDTFEVEARGGGPAIWIQSCSSIQLQRLSIYSSGGVGIITNYSPDVSIQNVKIIPRPETSRLVSTNAGGIAVNQTGGNNTIQNCRISGTQDDCISGNSAALNCVLVQPNIYLVVPGTTVYFVGPLTVAPVTDPASREPIVCTPRQAVTSGARKNAKLTVTMMSPMPRLPAQAMMYSTDPATRGNGLTIDSNDISSNTLARGIALSGQTGVTIRNNRLAWIQEAGIICGTNYAGNPKHRGSYSTFGPLSNIKIQNNHLH